MTCRNEFIVILGFLQNEAVHLIISVQDWSIEHLGRYFRKILIKMVARENPSAANGDTCVDELSGNYEDAHPHLISIVYPHAYARIGYLLKKTKHGQWQKRWVETSGCFLTYYKVRSVDSTRSKTRIDFHSIMSGRNGDINY